MSKALIRDYGLQEDENLKINWNRFMNHIGECDVGIDWESQKLTAGGIQASSSNL